MTSDSARPRCELCGEPITDPTAPGVYRMTRGWVKQRDGGGGHAVALAERLPEWAHGFCIERKAAGRWGQGEMF